MTAPRLNLTAPERARLKTMGRNIFDRRSGAGMTAKELSELVGIDPATLARYEAGQTKQFDVNLAIRFLEPLAFPDLQELMKP